MQQKIKKENLTTLTKEELKEIFGGGAKRVRQYCHEAQQWVWVWIKV